MLIFRLNGLSYFILTTINVNKETVKDPYLVFTLNFSASKKEFDDKIEKTVFSGVVLI